MADNLGELEYSVKIKEDEESIKAIDESLREKSDQWSKLLNIPMGEQSIEKVLNSLKEYDAAIVSSMQKRKEIENSGAIDKEKLNQAQEKSKKTILETLAAEEKLNIAVKKRQQASVDASTKEVISKQKIQQAILKTTTEQGKANEKQIKSSIQQNKLDTQKVINQEKIQQAVLRTSAAEERLAASKNKSANATIKQNKEYKKQSLYLQNLKTLAASYLSIFAAFRLANDIRRVTGEFELQNKALAAIIQNKDKANRIFEQVTDLALKSPFGIRELLSYTKQLAAYRIESNQLVGTLTKLADVSAGLGVDMNRLILAYGQVKAASVLRGQELRQFTEAGIPLVSLLAEKFSDLEGRVVSTNEVFDKISSRAVSFKMVSEIFEDMTNKGGIFFEAQKVQAETLAGMWNIFSDSLDKAYNQIGQSNLNVIKGSVQGATDLVRNWKTVLDVLKNIVLAFGVYKTSLLISGAAVNKHRIALALMSAGSKEAALSQGLLNQKQLEGVATSNRLALSFRKLGISLKASLAGNWVGLLLTALTSIGYALYESSQRTKEMSEAFYTSLIPMTKQAKVLGEIAEKLEDVNISETERIKLLKKAKEASDGAVKSNMDVVESLDAIQKKQATIEAVKSIKTSMFESGDELKELKDEQAEIVKEYDKNLRLLETKYLIFRDKIKDTDISEPLKKQLDAISDSNRKFKSEGLRAFEFFKLLIEEQKKARKKLGTGFIDALVPENISVPRVKRYRELKKLVEEASLGGVFKDASDSVDEFVSKNKEVNAELENTFKLVDLQAKKLSTIFDDPFEEFKEDILRGLNLSTIKITPPTVEYTDFQKAIDKVRTSFIDLNEISETSFGKQVLPKDATTNVTKWFKTIVDGYNKQTQSAIDLEKERKAIEKSQIKRSQKEVESLNGRIKYAKNLRDLYKALIDAFNIPVKKATGGETDALKNLKAELDLYKKIKKSREDLSKTFTTPDTEAQIKKLYGEQAKDLNISIPVSSDTSAFYSQLNKLADKAEEIGGKAGKQWAKGLRNNIGKMQVDDLTKTAKEALKELDQEIKDYKGKYKFYKDILGISGDKTLAIKVALEGEDEASNFIDTLKKKVLDYSKEQKKEQKIDFSKIFEGEVTFDKLYNNLDKLPPEIAKRVKVVADTIDKTTQDSLLARLKLQYSEFADGMGIEFDFSNVITKLNKDVKKAKADLETALEDKSITKTDKEQIAEITKLNIASISEVARQRVEKMGGAYIKERLEIEGLGAAYSNMTNASLEDINKIIDAIEKSKQGLLDGEGLTSIFEKSGLSENITSNLFKGLEDSSDIDDFLNKLKEVKEATEKTTNLKIGGELVDDKASGEISILIQLLETLAKSLKNTGESAKKMRLDKQIRNWKNLQKEINELLDVVKTLGNELGVGMSNSGQKAIQAIKNSATGIMSIISNTAALTAKKISAVEKASVILAIISAALKIVNEINNLLQSSDDSSINSAKAKTDEIAKQVRMETTINALYRERNKLQGESLTLGLTYGQQVSEALKLAEGSGEDFNNTMKALLDNAIFSERESWKNLWGVGWSQSKRFSFTLKDILEQINPDGTSIGSSIFTALFDLGDIFGNTQKGKAQQEAFNKIVKNMKAAFAELEKQGVDTANMTNKEWLTFFNVMKEAGNITDEATLKLIENAKEALREMEKQMEKVREIITSVTGGIGNELGDSLVDSFARGEDGAKAFKKTVENVLEDILKQKIINKIFEKDFDKLEKEMEASMSFGGDGDWVDDIIRFFNSSKGKVDDVRKAIETIREEGKKQGLDLFGIDSDMGSLAEGIKGITEDTARRLEALMNSIREQVILQSSSLAEATKTLDAINNLQAEGLGYLVEIANNTEGIKTAIEQVLTSSSEGTALRVNMV